MLEALKKLIIIKNNMKIWIEVELHSECYSCYDIADRSWLSFSEFRPMIFNDWREIDVKVKMSEEYYSDTIEYNFTPFNINKKICEDVSDWLKEQMEKYSLKLSKWNPKFCWTHVHIFDKKHLDIDHDTIFWKLLSKLKWDLPSFEKHSVERLMKAHQLWTYWCHNHDNAWHKKLSKYNYKPKYYDYHRDKVKYSPVYDSPKSRTGKPKSLEIRFLPNEYVFNGEIYNIFKGIEDGSFFDIEPISCSDFIEACGEVLWMGDNIPTWEVFSREGVIRAVNDLRDMREDNRNEAIRVKEKLAYVLEINWDVKTISWNKILINKEGSIMYYKIGGGHEPIDNIFSMGLQDLKDFLYVVKTRDVMCYELLVKYLRLLDRNLGVNFSYILNDYPF